MSSHSFRSWFVVVCASVSLVGAFASSAAAKTGATHLAPVDASIGARVGASVDVDKDTLVLGAPDDLEAGPFAGAVYVFGRKGQSWKLEAKLLGPDTSGFREFGEAVAISGDTIVVGAPFDGPEGESRGAAYVYTRKGNAWSLQTRLTPSDPAPNQLFGDAVAIDGDTIVVGAFLDSVAAPNAGAAYVFERASKTWTQRAKLTASDASEFAFFGAALAIEGKNIVVGSPIAGTAYVFAPRGQTWVQQAILRPYDESPSTYNAFGASVALDGSTIVVGAPLEGTGAPGTGAVYTFQKQGSTWTAQPKLVGSDLEGNDEFGTAVAVEGKHIAVGAPYHGASNTGAVFVFEKHGAKWQQSQEFTADPTTAFLGAAVALNKNALVAGAPAFVDFGGKQSAGAGFVFQTK